MHDERPGDYVVEAPFAGVERDHQESDAEHYQRKNLCQEPHECSPERDPLAVRVSHRETAESLANGPLPGRALHDRAVEQLKGQKEQQPDRA